MDGRHDLSRANTDVLFAQLRATGDRAARNELVERHRRLACSAARKYSDRGEPLADLEQVALMALLRAVERFRPERGAFVSYALVSMGGALRRHFRDATWSVHVPRPTKDLQQRMAPHAEALAQQLGRAPRPAELAERLGVGVDDVLLAETAGAAYKARGFTQPGGPDLERDPAARDGSDEATEAAMVRSAVGRLPARDQQILALRFEKDPSQREIAQHIGVSQVQVSRCLRKIFDGLRHDLDDTPPLPPAACLTDTSPMATQAQQLRQLKYQAAATSAPSPPN